tara:strand:+ start:1052 stop:1216 length:165 start_codon:yes stop_codon:yes gene_type:complete
MDEIVLTEAKCTGCNRKFKFPTFLSVPVTDKTCYRCEKEPNNIHPIITIVEIND